MVWPNTEEQRRHRAEYVARWYREHRNDPGFKERGAANSKKYNYLHREEISIKKANKRKEHAKELSEYQKAYYKIHREKILASNKARQIIKKEEIRDASRFRIYGLSKENYLAILNKQNNVCAICLKPEWCGKEPHVDHDHVSGRVRGIVCCNCNRAMGMIKDDPWVAKRMSDYLENHKEIDPPK